jgi:hypothetical protein
LIVVCPRRCLCFRLPPPFLPAPAVATAAVPAPLTMSPPPQPPPLFLPPHRFSAAVTTASMFQRFRLPLCYNVSAAAAAAASVSIAIATIVSAKTITDKKC